MWLWIWFCRVIVAVCLFGCGLIAVYLVALYLFVLLFVWLAVVVLFVFDCLVFI